MDRYEGQARLQWWANSLTCLGDVGIQVTIEPGTEVGWSARATATPPLAGDDAEGFDFLMAMSPFFTLCLPDGRTIPVAVEAVPDGLRLTPDQGDPPDRGPATIELS